MTDVVCVYRRRRLLAAVRVVRCLPAEFYSGVLLCAVLQRISLKAFLKNELRSAVWLSSSKFGFEPAAEQTTHSGRLAACVTPIAYESLAPDYHLPRARPDSIYLSSSIHQWSTQKTMPEILVVRTKRLPTKRARLRRLPQVFKRSRSSLLIIPEQF